MYGFPATPSDKPSLAGVYLGTITGARTGMSNAARI
jgi:hypothetical protein